MMMFSRFDICLHREGNRNSKYLYLYTYNNSRDVWLSCVHVIDQKEKIHRSEDIQLFVHEQMHNKNGH